MNNTLIKSIKTSVSKADNETSGIRSEKITTKYKFGSVVILAFATLLIAGCNSKNNTDKEDRSENTASSSERNEREDDKQSIEKIYRGMEMVKSGNAMVNKGETDNDQAMMDRGLEIMDEGMVLVEEGKKRMGMMDDDDE